MRDQRTDHEQARTPAALNRREILAAGAGLVAAPLLAATATHAAPGDDATSLRIDMASLRARSKD